MRSGGSTGLERCQHYQYTQESQRELVPTYKWCLAPRFHRSLHGIIEACKHNQCTRKCRHSINRYTSMPSVFQTGQPINDYHYTHPKQQKQADAAIWSKITFQKIFNIIHEVKSKTYIHQQMLPSRMDKSCRKQGIPVLLMEYIFWPAYQVCK
ncbi:hypothetical protein SAMN05216436_11426 [bacterium A37T11]|nr:hypothetical protein SAMN05216436_11426 [bacterium A37T11]